MLDERKASILRAVVEEYIQTAQPVGSAHVAAAAGERELSSTDIAHARAVGLHGGAVCAAGLVLLDPAAAPYHSLTTRLCGPDDGAGPDARGIADAHGRLMVVMVHNTDMPDGWEREGEDPEYFFSFSPDAYAVGINIVLYAMTH